ncbi:MAG: hypothetical protein ACOZNI_17235 [Myxococcota bacterium]
MEDVLLAQIAALAEARATLPASADAPELDELRDALAEEEALRIGCVAELVSRRWSPPARRPA